MPAGRGGAECRLAGPGEPWVLNPCSHQTPRHVCYLGNWPAEVFSLTGITECRRRAQIIQNGTRCALSLHDPIRVPNGG
jgi:hypothetical protein